MTCKVQNWVVLVILLSHASSLAFPEASCTQKGDGAMLQSPTEEFCGVESNCLFRLYGEESNLTTKMLLSQQYIQYN